MAFFKNSKQFVFRDVLKDFCDFFGTRTLLCFGHGCSGDRMLLEQNHYCALGMDALVTVCSWNRIIIVLWAWMLW